ncbi:Oidioi.mRNA.OKI2018_I69.chr1.g1181.t1.cds [Oikopleura dioica]|uniref:Protein YIPF n=1 Tax=Oikopleura dioica TaxID=34765 RepID=A0ABN7SM43_OIKDI|nr:Oidioi.mRNA.OKI2018_I69.chr1.g1181.t1.cds [Oikopleura dioica]
MPGAQPSKKTYPSLFSISFYQKCWDVTTNEVRLRVKSAMMPREDFLKNLRGKPDLYGPFWVAVTLCFSTAICGNLANFVQNKGDPAYVYAPEFERVTSAASAIFGYVFVFPMFLSVVMYYSKIMTGFSAVELLTAYGYSLSIFIPISFFWIIPVEFIRWLLVIFASVVSGAVVGLPIYNGLKAVTNKQKAYAVLALAVVANLGLSVGFKMYFFEAPLNPSGFVPPVQPPVEIQQQPVVPENPVEVEEVAPIVDEAPAVENPVVPEVPEPVEPQAVESVEESKEVAEPELVAQEQVQDAPEAVEAPEAPVEAPVVDAEEAAREEHVEEVLHQLPRVASPVQAAAEEPAQVPEVQAPEGAEG